MIALVTSIAIAAAGPIGEAVHTEIERAHNELQLADQPTPHVISAEILEGNVATSVAEFGAITSHDAGPYRTARIEVRVGDAALDSSNFSGAFGVRNGISSRDLPHEHVGIALRRELWLALDGAYKGATEQLAAKRAAREGRDTEHPPALVPADPIQLSPVPVAAIDEDRSRGLVTALTRALADRPTLEEGAAAARDWQGRRLIQTTEGTDAWLRTGHTVVRVEVVGRSADGARLRNTRSWVARTTDQLPDVASMITEVEAMADWIEGLQTAPVERDYLGPVLFEGQAATELFRQLLHPEICGTPPVEVAPDPLQVDATPTPTARIGRRLLPAGWTVVDDPTRTPSAAGAYTHDFEGIPAQAVSLIGDGVLKDVLMSRVPRLDRSKSTGHGRSLGTDRREAVPGHVRVVPRRGRSPAAMRRAAVALSRQAGNDYVLVVRRLTPPGLTEDFHMAFTGDGPLPGLTPPTEIFRLYPDGREEPIRGAQFVGVDRRALRDIAAAGRPGASTDMMDAPGRSSRFNIGAVGGLPVTWSAPAVVITEMELRGSGGGEARVIPPPPTTIP